VPARDIRSRLVRRAAKSNVFVSDALATGLSSYYDLLSRWNRKINLTALDGPDEGVDRLLLEPLVATRHFPAGTARLIDIGSGGGSPAIPFSLAIPSLKVTMVEVKARKSAFLREAVRQLRLVNTTVENARFEELLARPELHEASDIVSVRAVRIEPRILTSLQAFLRDDGIIMLFRGPGGPESIAAVPPLESIGTFPLVESLQSRITLLAKRRLR
jgi:16S rRNA (guanine527-N7)-methyltransferase